jgi:hypothetical protein
MMYEEHRASMEKGRNVYSISVGKPKEGSHMEDLNGYGRIFKN